MPRRYPHSQADYSHLYGKSPSFILDAALQNRTFGLDIKNYEVRANQAVLRIFGDANVLTLAELKERVDAVREGRVWSDEFTLDVIGNAIAWGIHLAIVERTGDGQFNRSFRLLYREPAYEIIGGKAMKVLGLPADEQIAMNCRRSRLHRLRVTLAIKRAAKVRKQAEPLIDRMVAADRDVVVPVSLFGFLDGTFAQLSLDMSVREVREYLVDAHDLWEPVVQARWLNALAEATETIEFGARVRAKREAEEVILPEDLDAFASI
ncbi:hypothetical protein ACLBWX_18410 [Methylobacterium sp. M6A4_1b]